MPIVVNLSEKERLKIREYLDMGLCNNRIATLLDRSFGIINREAKEYLGVEDSQRSTIALRA